MSNVVSSKCKCPLALLLHYTCIWDELTYGMSNTSQPLNSIPSVSNPKSSPSLPKHWILYHLYLFRSPLPPHKCLRTNCNISNLEWVSQLYYKNRITLSTIVAKDCFKVLLFLRARFTATDCPCLAEVVHNSNWTRKYCLKLYSLP